MYHWPPDVVMNLDLEEIYFWFEGMEKIAEWRTNTQ